MPQQLLYNCCLSQVLRAPLAVQHEIKNLYDSIYEQMILPLCCLQANDVISFSTTSIKMLLLGLLWICVAYDYSDVVTLLNGELFNYNYHHSNSNIVSLW